MRMSKLYMPTLKEVPAEAEIPSHQLLLRAGMTRQLVSGIYSYLPLGYRVIRKVEQIVREEMDRHGSQEVLMSAIQPREIWEDTGRWDDFGPEMFKLKDRHNREFCLGPTHEEYFTDLIKNELRSYKELPLNIYQIQTKYRDEKRPRFGFMRSREFIMKDAYTFDASEEDMIKSYNNMWEAYKSVFDRLNLDYRIVEGDSGTMGGNISHEYMAMSDYGESLIAYCEECSYAATDEKAKVTYNVKEEEILDSEYVHTPGATTIDDLKKLFKQPGSKFAKSLLFSVKNEVIMAIIPGDRELNETKLSNYLGVGEHELNIASDEQIKKVTGAIKGYSGPIDLKEEIRIIIDSRISKMNNLIVGANKTNYHIKNANYGVDFKGELVEDLLVVEEGDICPECGSRLLLARGIEVGNIFQLGTKYSTGIGAKFLDSEGKERPFYMGSYGIGITRSVAAIIEQYHDEHGIVWPINVAPYQIIITIINMKNKTQVKLGEEIYKKLEDKGYEVLLDDRSERAGVKFNDRDLIGIPIRITIGRDADNRIVEYSLRKYGKNENISVDDLLKKVMLEFK